MTVRIRGWIHGALLFAGVVALACACGERRSDDDLLSGAGHGSGSSGGDNLRILALEAKARASSAAYHAGPSSFGAGVEQGIADWLAEHHIELGSDIAESPHAWTESSVATCAETRREAKATVVLSLPTCRATMQTIEDAAKLLTHESVHHLGIAEESFADKVALALAGVAPAPSPVIRAEAPAEPTILTDAIQPPEPTQPPEPSIRVEPAEPKDPSPSNPDSKPSQATTKPEPIEVVFAGLLDHSHTAPASEVGPDCGYGPIRHSLKSSTPISVVGWIRTPTSSWTRLDDAAQVRLDGGEFQIEQRALYHDSLTPYCPVADVKLVIEGVTPAIEEPTTRKPVEVVFAGLLDHSHTAPASEVGINCGYGPIRHSLKSSTPISVVGWIRTPTSSWTRLDDAAQVRLDGGEFQIEQRALYHEAFPPYCPVADFKLVIEGVTPAI